MSLTIGQLFVEVVSKGFKDTKAQADKLKEALKGADEAAKNATKDVNKISLTGLIGKVGTELGKKLSAVGSAFADLNNRINAVGTQAQAAFTKASAGIVGFFALADPKGFDNLQVALARVGIQLGKIVVPMMREFTRWLNRAADWLKSLDDSTREQIANWIKWGLAVTAGLAVLPKVIGLITGVVRVVGLLKSAFTALYTASPIGALLLLLGVLSGLEDTDLSMDGITKAFGKVTDVITSVAKSIADFAKNVYDMISPVLDVFGGLIPVLEAVIKGLLVYKATMLTASIATGIANATIAIAQNGLSGLAASVSKMNLLAIGIGVVTTAVSLLAAALEKSTRKMDDMLKRADKMESIKERLEGGGKVTEKDIKELPTEIQKGLERTKNDPAARKKYLEEQIRQLKDKEKQEQFTDEKRLKVQETLEGMRSLPTSPNPFGKGRWQKRQEAIEETLGRKFTKEEEAKFEQLNKTENWFKRWMTKNDRLSDENIQDILKIFEVGGKKAGGEKAILEKMLKGEVEKKPGEKPKEDSDKFRGEMRPLKPELTSVQEFWNKLVTSQQNTKEMQIWLEQLKESRNGNELLKGIQEEIINGNKSKRGIIIN